MKGSRKLEKIAICIVLIIFLFNIFTNNIYAAINSAYDYTESTINDLDDKVVSSKVLNSVGKFVYALASMVEKIVGDVFYKLTGDSMFPWADRILFNTIPFLDINFINPSSGSLFLSKNQNVSMLTSMVRNVYFTLLTLAIGFLGVVVAIMAIRLAISTIAAEKSKYKKAIVNWLFAILMVFTVHIILSFVFYLNEKMVEVASSILQSQIQKNNIMVNFNVEDNIDSKALVDNFISDQKGVSWSISPSTLLDVITLPQVAIHDIRNAVNDLIGNKTPEEILKENYEIAAYFLKDAYYRSNYIGFAEGSGEDVGLPRKILYVLVGKFKDIKALEVVALDVVEVLNMTDEKYKFLMEYLDKNKDNEDMYIQRLIASAYRKFILKEDDDIKKNPEELIANMGEYFKKNVYTVKTDKYGNITGWAYSHITLQGALLYTIFVTQSILFFFAYVKRFFYVIVLSIMAPLVVIYDFLGKAVS